MWVSIADMNKGEFTLTYPGHRASGSFSQQGDMTKFTGESELNYDDRKFWTKVEFQGNGPVTLSIDVTTPLSVKKISANLEHDGTMARYACCYSNVEI